MMSRPASTQRLFGAVLRRGISTLACIALAACGGDGGTDPTPPAVGVSVSPTSTTIGAAESQAITATVSNASNSAVTWTSSGGTVSGSGSSISWTAPVAGGTYTVTATSAQDATRSATATITVTPVQVALTPAAPALLRGETTTLTATVTGTTASTAVSWTATCGTLTPAGNTATYEAPTTSGSCDVTATSDLDGSRSATSSVAVRQASAVTADDDTDDGACTFDHCSLREAINAANLVAGADTVYLSVAAAAAAPGAVSSRAASAAPAGSAGRFGPAGVIQATASLPTITSDLTLIGEGSGVTEIDMQGTALDHRRAFDVSAAEGAVTVDIHGLTVRNAYAMGGPALYVRDGATVHTMDVALRDNTAVDTEGGAMVVVGQGSTATMVNSIIDNNEVLNGFPGGGVGVVAGGSFSMTGGALTNNRTEAWGGGLRGFDAELISFDNTLIDGNQVLPGGFGGGGMFIENPGNAGGIVSLTGVTLTNNVATDAGAGGGAHLRDNLDVQIIGSTITGNSAVEGGGIVAGEANLLIDDTAIDDNRGENRGGGLLLYGTTTPVSFTAGSVSRNTTGASGGAGIFAQQDVAITMSGTQVNGNVVDPDGGFGGGFGLFNNVQLDATDVQINGNSARSAGGIYGFGNGALSIDLTTSTVDANQATTFSGGGIFVEGSGAVMLDRTTLSNNVALGGSGGGLWAFTGVTVDIVDSFVIDNSTGVSGGGLWLRGPALIDRTLIQGNDAVSNGGGISANSDVVVQHSTLTGNTAGDRGGAIFFYEGGATPLRILNSTLSGNMADRGGALGIMGDAEVVHSSVIGNSATGLAGAFWVQNVAPGGSITATNSLFAANTGGGVANTCEADPTAGGSFPSGGGNLVDETSCAFGLSSDQNDTAAGVDPTLADNGGPTPTHALLAGSAAIDAGIDAGLSTDQRGQARVNEPDVGAFELGG